MADMGKTEVTATIEARISAMIQAQLIESSKLIPTVMNMPAEDGIDRISMPRTGNFTVDDKAENTAVTPQVLTYAVDTLLLDKYKVIQFFLEDNARVQAKPDMRMRRCRVKSLFLRWRRGVTAKHFRPLLRRHLQRSHL